MLPPPLPGQHASLQMLFHVEHLQSLQRLGIETMPG